MDQRNEFTTGVKLGSIIGFGIGMMFTAAIVLVLVTTIRPVQAAGDKVQKVKIEGTVKVKIVGPVSNEKPIRVKQVK